MTDHPPHHSIRPGDWVEIVCPEKPWFHGEIAEVLNIYMQYSNGQATLELAFSRTPGHRVTLWSNDYLRPVARPDAVAELGEDYFA